jgi:hypothetical protein
VIGDLAAPLQGQAAHRSMTARAFWCTKHDRERGKMKWESRDCSPRVANGLAGGGSGSRRWAAPLGSGDDGGSLR